MIVAACAARVYHPLLASCFARGLRCMKQAGRGCRQRHWLWRRHMLLPCHASRRRRDGVILLLKITAKPGQVRCSIWRLASAVCGALSLAARHNVRSESTFCIGLLSGRHSSLSRRRLAGSRSTPCLRCMVRPFIIFPRQRRRGLLLHPTGAFMAPVRRPKKSSACCRGCFLFVVAHYIICNTPCQYPYAIFLLHITLQSATCGF